MKMIIILFLTLNLFGNVKQNMFTLYKSKKYKDVCTLGFNNFYRNKKDEEFVSMYAFACLYSDYIDRLAIPITMLKLSQGARLNASYFSVVLMQKKLLYHALIDDYDISELKLPTTDYILSKVFDLYVKIGQHIPRAFYLFEDPNDKKLTYKLYILKDKKINKMIIEEFHDKIFLKRHIYW